ncbi:hypothetical protein [Sphingobacterium sp. LRF_L2]|uniref:hypothetical protein n=1 Tax=Sphingobacterium sp. LRF_L2 TaxID=3369421 RepID=UPI003F638FED
MNVWEKIPESDSYESVLPKVSNFVKSIGDKMSYNVAVDHGERYFAKEWLKKAQAPGIPTTFLIKDGQFLWIGHPSKLEAVITQVIDGTFNIQEMRAAHQASIELSKKATNAHLAEIAPIDQAIKEKKFEKAFALIDTVIARDPMQKYTLNIRKFNILLENVSEKEALTFVDEWKKKDGDRVAIYPAQSIVDKTGLSKETYLYAANVFNRGAQETQKPNPMFYELAAKAYSLAGDYKNAVDIQTKAVESAKESLKSSNHVGIIHDYTVTEYEQTLKTYQNKLL